MNTQWSSTTRHIVGVGLALFWLFLLYISLPILPIIIISGLAAFLLTPIIDMLNTRLKIPRRVAVLFAYFMLILFVLLAPLILSEPAQQGFQLLQNIPYLTLVDNLITSLQTDLENVRTIQLPLIGRSIDLTLLIDPVLATLQEADSSDFFRASISLLPSITTVIDYLQSVVTVTFGMAASVVGTTFSWIITLIVTLMCAIYFTLDAHKFMAYFINLAPEPYRPELEILINRLKRVWQSYIRGQATLMLMIGVLTGLGNWMLGVPGAFALGVIAGMLELLPYLGPFLAAVPAVVIALIQGSTYFEVSNVTFAFMVIGMYVVIQQTENVIVIPRVLGYAVKLHPLVVIIGVVIGVSVGGILGALVATPIIASGREIVGYLYAKVLGQEPYPIQPKPQIKLMPVHWWIWWPASRRPKGSGSGTDSG
ncbi:AI-2E family transporter [Anaerolineales bacterium HSG24]|nr:AI-2E family transporter [Anaerolineales bacterium HSG24]